MHKDITFGTKYSGCDTSYLSVYYGEKKLIETNVFNDDITEIKAIVLSVQVEMLKDAIKAPAPVVNNFFAAPKTENPLI